MVDPQPHGWVDPILVQVLAADPPHLGRLVAGTHRPADRRNFPARFSTTTFTDGTMLFARGASGSSR
jgi:hypothetical protein